MRRILVVDDDPHICLAVRAWLKRYGFNVAIADGGATGLVALDNSTFDLMIVDIKMGEGSGVAAVKEILHEGFVPHVFATGDLLRNLDLGPDAVLIQKPYRRADLVAAIERAIGGATSQTVESAPV